MLYVYTVHMLYVHVLHEKKFYCTVGIGYIKHNTAPYIPTEIKDIYTPLQQSRGKHIVVMSFLSVYPSIGYKCKSFAMVQT